MPYQQTDIDRLIYLVREVRENQKHYHTLMKNNSEKQQEVRQASFRMLRHFETQLDEHLAKAFTKSNGTEVVLNIQK